jgi:hypothetical protein
LGEAGTRVSADGEIVSHQIDIAKNHRVIIMGFTLSINLERLLTAFRAVLGWGVDRKIFHCERRPVCAVGAERK